MRVFSSAMALGYGNFSRQPVERLRIVTPPAGYRLIIFAVRLLALLFVLALFAGTVLAQQGGKDQHKQQPQRQMKQEDRERMRDDMRNAYRPRQGQPEQRPRQMSQEERNKLRRDIEDANRSMRK